MSVEPSSEGLRRIVEKARLEGVLACLKQLGNLATSKMTLEELKHKMAKYFNEASSALANHCLEDVKIAGFPHGLFEEEGDRNE